MPRILVCLSLFAALLAGCDGGGSRAPAGIVGDAPQAEFGFMEATSSPLDPGPSGDDAARWAAQDARMLAGSGQSDGENREPSQEPQIAYSYAVGFRVDADQLPTLQQRHVDLCESMVDRCRILFLSQSGDADYGYGTIRLQVIASEAPEFSDQLRAATEGVEAEQVSYAVSGEDLTDNIIDTEAHLEGRRLLRDRLMEVLRTQRGSVGEIVEAERGVAQVNEEIDAAASRLANMRNRVAFSSFQIEYSPRLGETRLGFWRPVSEAFSGIGTTLGVVIAGIIYVAVSLVPITIFLIGLRWLWRRSGLRIRRRREDETE